MHIVAICIDIRRPLISTETEENKTAKRIHYNTIKRYYPRIEIYLQRS